MEGIKDETLTHTYAYASPQRRTNASAHSHIYQTPGIMGYIRCNQTETKTAAGLHHTHTRIIILEI